MDHGATELVSVCKLVLLIFSDNVGVLGVLGVGELISQQLSQLCSPQHFLSDICTRLGVWKENKFTKCCTDVANMLVLCPICKP